jgi:hypothetical protein
MKGCTQYLNSTTTASIAPGSGPAMLDMFKSWGRFPPAPLCLCSIEHYRLRKTSKVSQTLINAGDRRGSHRYDGRLGYLSGDIRMIMGQLSPNSNHGHGREVLIVFAHGEGSKLAIASRRRSGGVNCPRHMALKLCEESSTYHSARINLDNESKLEAVSDEEERDFSRCLPRPENFGVCTQLSIRNRRGRYLTAPPENGPGEEYF